MIGAGLASGQTGYWQGIQYAGGLPGCSGFAVHPYAKTAPLAKALLQRYQAITPTLPCWVTEWNRPPAEVPGFAAMLRQTVAMSAWFCWGQSVAQGAGIYPLDATTKRLLGASL
jgi:hypothetical protein